MGFANQHQTNARGLRFEQEQQARVAPLPALCGDRMLSREGNERPEHLRKGDIQHAPDTVKQPLACILKVHRIAR